jgi:hypothetical protein
LLNGLVQDGTRTEHALDHRPRRLARPKAGDARLACQAHDSLIDSLGEALWRNLELELEA